MADGREGSSEIRIGSVVLDPFQVGMGFGALLIAAGVLLALDELIDGGSYSVWFALLDLTEAVALGALVLLAARRLGRASWSGDLIRAAPVVGVALVAASIALTVRDATDELDFWVVLNDLFYWIPLTLGVLIYLSGTDRRDRLFGVPSEWGRAFAVIALIAGLAIAINDFSDVSNDKLLVFLDSFAFTGGLALLLLAASLEPVEERKVLNPGSYKPQDIFNDPRVADAIAVGAVFVIAVGVLLGLDVLGDGGNNAFWRFIQVVGFKLGLGVVILIAAGGRVGPYFDASHPYLRYVLAGAFGAMLLAGLWLAIDASSNQIWLLLDNLIVDVGYLGLALVMYEATAAMRRE